MKKLFSFISLICVLNVLMLGGIAGFLWGTGRLDKGKAQTIADILKQPGTPAGFREKVYDLMTPVAATGPATATAPATQSAVAEADALEPATADERIDYMHKALEADRLRMENEAQNLRHQQELLAQMQSQLELDRKDLAAQKKSFDDRVAAAKGNKDTAGFDKTMALFQELKPKQVKDLLTSMQEDEAVRYLAAMEPDQAAKIIAEFKSPTEKAFLNTVMDRLRGKQGGGTTSGDPSGTGAASGSTTGSGTVVAAPPLPSAKDGP